MAVKRKYNLENIPLVDPLVQKEGISIKEACKRLNVLPDSYYRRKKQNGEGRKPKHSPRISQIDIPTKSRESNIVFALIGPNKAVTEALWNWSFHENN